MHTCSGNAAFGRVGGGGSAGWSAAAAFALGLPQGARRCWAAAPWRPLGAPPGPPARKEPARRPGKAVGCYSAKALGTECTRARARATRHQALRRRTCRALDRAWRDADHAYPVPPPLQGQGACDAVNRGLGGRRVHLGGAFGRGGEAGRGAVRAGSAARRGAPRAAPPGRCAAALGASRGRRRAAAPPRGRPASGRKTKPPLPLRSLQSEGGTAPGTTLRRSAAWR